MAGALPLSPNAYIRLKALLLMVINSWAP